MAKLKTYIVTVEEAVGGQDYPNVVDCRWDDLKSTTYLVLVFANGHILKLNDFSVRKVFIRPTESGD